MTARDNETHFLYYPIRYAIHLRCQHKTEPARVAKSSHTQSGNYRGRERSATTIAIALSDIIANLGFAVCRFAQLSGEDVATIHSYTSALPEFAPRSPERLQRFAGIEGLALGANGEQLCLSHGDLEPDRPVHQVTVQVVK